MRPLPTTPDSLPVSRQESQAPAPAGRVLELGSTPANSNQRRTTCPTQRAYPWLLGISTAMAGMFCFLYINKPVIVAAGEAPTAERTALAATPLEKKEHPARKIREDETPTPGSSLPGESTPKVRATEPRSLGGSGSSYEETNLRIQHVLGAQGNGGEDLGRIVLDVPVLYQSGSIRWTREDVAKARSLLTRIGAYQEKSRALREEAVTLISEWDGLIVSSIPEGSLRADSPTLPENQGIGAAGEAPLNTTDSIEIETP